MARNVLGGELATCSNDPLTGFYRNGCCDTGGEDSGVHTVCARVTAEFLEFSAEAGNDLKLVCRELARMTRDLLVITLDPSRLYDPVIRVLRDNWPVILPNPS